MKTLKFIYFQIYYYKGLSLSILITLLSVLNMNGQNSDYFLSQNLNTTDSYIITAKHSKKVLQVSNNKNGAHITQHQKIEGINQQFQLKNKGNGYYNIVSVSSGKALDIGASSKKNGAKLIQYNIGKGTNQQFKLIDKGNGYCQLRLKHSGKNLDIPGSSKKDGVVIIQYQASNGSNQLFRFTKVSSNQGSLTSNSNSNLPLPGTTPAASPLKLMSGKTVGENLYVLTSAQQRSKVIDISGSGQTEGTKVNFWRRTNNLNQLFWFAPVSSYEFMMVPHYKLDQMHGGPSANSKSRSVISYSKSDNSLVSINSGRKNNSNGFPKPNSNLSIQLFEVTNNTRSNETHIAIKTKKGYFTYKGGKLIISPKFEGISSTFIFEKTSERGAPKGLFSQSYTAPVPIAPLSTTQLNSINTVQMENGKLEKYIGTNIWIRKDKYGKTIDVLKETSRKNGQIYLKTENNMAANFPLSTKITDLIITSNYVLNNNSIIADFIKSTNSKTIRWQTGYGYLNILKFRGMVVMMYATNQQTFTDGCSGGAPREKNMFVKACDNHDDNWAAPWKMAGYTDEVGQKISDAIFIKDMKTIAGNSWDREVSAGAFYRAVRSTDEAQNNFKQSRTKESTRHVMLYAPPIETRNVFTKIVKEEYAGDALDDVVNFVGDTKTFFKEDFIEFFEGIF